VKTEIRRKKDSGKIKNKNLHRQCPVLKTNNSHFADSPCFSLYVHYLQKDIFLFSMAVVPPISLATTFKQNAPADFKQ
jgi:hypothetical protein